MNKSIQIYDIVVISDKKIINSDYKSIANEEQSKTRMLLIVKIYSKNEYVGFPITSQGNFGLHSKIKIGNVINNDVVSFVITQKIVISKKDIIRKLLNVYIKHDDIREIEKWI